MKDSKISNEMNLLTPRMHLPALAPIIEAFTQLYWMEKETDRSNKFPKAQPDSIDFMYMLKEDSRHILPKLEKEYRLAKPGVIAWMVYALYELGIIENPFDNKEALHRSLSREFKSIGDPGGFRRNLNLLAKGKHKEKIRQHKDKIMSFL